MIISRYKINFISFVYYGLFCCIVVSCNSSEEIPQVNISNDIIQATLYLPDVEKGYYRSTRFDWSGVIASLEYDGHSYFGKWFEEYDPYKHDAILGPVEEFTPLGFDEAEPGDHFVKLGVGALIRPDSGNYNRFDLYDTANFGKWSVNTYSDHVEFTHELIDESGYSYIYRKVVSLIPEKPELLLEHWLHNTGTKPIETSVYNHNFFVIDEEPTGPNILTIFPFEVSAEGRGFGSIAEAVDNKIQFKRQLKKTEQVFSSGLQGLRDTVADYDIRIENRKTEAGVRITGNRPIEKLVFWASSTTSCPEPYINLYAEPGKEIYWNNKYEFYTN